MGHSQDDVPVFFCIGAAKSGTTLLARVLDQHPDIACIWESHAFAPRAKASLFNPASDKWKTHGFAEEDVRQWAKVWRAEPRHSVRRLLRRLTGRTYLAVSCFRQTMSQALADFAQRCNASVVGDKWPIYTSYLAQTLAAFPDARFIYNVRDPRGVWNSGQRFKGRNRGDATLQNMLEREQMVAPYLDREQFLTVRYQDLVLNPKEVCRQLYEFLGCGFLPSYLHYARESRSLPRSLGLGARGQPTIQRVAHIEMERTDEPGTD